MHPDFRRVVNDTFRLVKATEGIIRQGQVIHRDLSQKPRPELKVEIKKP